MRKKILIIFLILLALLCVGCDDNDVNVSVARTEGLSLLESGEYELAIEKFQLSLKGSNDESTLLNISKAYYALEQYEKSRDYIIQAIDNTDVDSSEEHRVYGDILFKLSHNELALEQFKIATNLDKTNSYAWYSLGLYYESIEDYDQYVEAIKNADDESEDLKFTIYLMDAYISSYDLLAFYEMIPSLYNEYPDNFGISKKYGQYLALQSKENEAIEHYKSMEVTFDHADVMILAPEYLYELRKYNECIEHMASSDIISQSHAFIELYTKALFAVYKSDEAHEIANEIISLNSDDYYGYYLKGKLFTYVLNNTEAIEYFKKATDLTDDFTVHNTLLMALYNSNEIEEFRKLAYSMLDEFGKKTSVIEYLLKSYMSLDTYDDTAKVYREKYNYTDQYLIDKAQLESGVRALSYIQAAVSFDPQNNTVHEYLLLIDILISLDKGDEANEALIKAIDLSNEDSVFEHLLSFDLSSVTMENISTYLNILLPLSHEDQLVLVREKIMLLEPKKISFEDIATYIDLIKPFASTEEVMNVLDRWNQTHSNMANGYRIKAFYLKDLGYDYESIEPLEKYIEIQSTQAAYGILFYAYYESDMFFKAQDFYYENLEMFSGNTDIKLSLAYTHTLLGEYDKSIKILEMILKDEPDNNEVKYELASVYYDYLGDEEKALEYINDYESHGDILDSYISDLKNQIEMPKKLMDDVSLLKQLFLDYYFYEANLDAFNGLSGELSNEEADRLLMKAKDKDDIFTFLLHGNNYANQAIALAESALEFEILDDYLYYAKISTFIPTVSYEFLQAIDSIDEPKESTLIIDLRDNGGGGLIPTRKVLDYLLGETTIFVTKNEKDDDIIYESNVSQIKFKEIYILVNSNTASSSEILTLSLSFNLDNVTIVGEQTRGKGVGQVTLNDNINKRQYFIVNNYWYVDDINIQGVGITPDVFVENNEINNYMMEMLNLTNF